MKSKILTSAVILFTGLIAFAQNGFLPSKEPMYSIGPSYKRAVKKEKLSDAKFISDVIEGYPSNWITSYVSVEIEATCNGKTMKAVSSNEILSTEQKNILNKIDQATYVVVNVKYIYKEPFTFIVENNRIHVSLMVIPDREAEFVGGKEQMIKYLKENITYKVPDLDQRYMNANPKQFRQGRVRFTVNEHGEIDNAKIFSTTGDQKTDQLLLEGINKMPKWKPAENSNGIRVKQEFEFWIGNGGC